MEGIAIMNTSSLRVLSFLLTFCLVGALAVGEPAEKQKGAEAAKESSEGPQFKKPASSKDFEKAKSLFAEGKFKEAETIFKRVKEDAKGKADKDAIDKWVQGTAGGFLLEKYKVMAKQNRLQIYDEAQKSFARYRGTAAEGLYTAFFAEIESQLFQVIEDFDTESRDYIEKYGKTFVKEPPQLLLDGTQCLRWTNTADRKAATLKIEKVPADWSPFEFLELWTNIAQPPMDPQAVIMCGDQDAQAKKKVVGKKKPAAKTQQDFFITPLAKMLGAPGQWHRVRIPLTEFKPQGSPSLSSVSYFQLQVRGGATFNLLIDKVALIRKETKEGAAAQTPKAAPKATPKSGTK